MRKLLLSSGTWLAFKFKTKIFMQQNQKTKWKSVLLLVNNNIQNPIIKYLFKRINNMSGSMFISKSTSVSRTCSSAVSNYLLVLVLYELFFPKNRQSLNPISAGLLDAAWALKGSIMSAPFRSPWITDFSITKVYNEVVMTFQLIRTIDK